MVAERDDETVRIERASALIVEQRPKYGRAKVGTSKLLVANRKVFAAAEFDSLLAAA
jgi:hypothetical protein